MKRQHSVFGGQPEAPLRRFVAAAGPARGFSVSELNEVGISLEEAQRVGIPVEVGRVGLLSTNVSALRSWMR